MSGLNLLEMIMQAQNGVSAKEAGNVLGLNPSQTRQAIAALLPAISSVLKKNTQSPQGLAGLLQALQSGSHEQYLNDPSKMQQADTISDGNAILEPFSKLKKRVECGRLI